MAESSPRRAGILNMLEQEYSLRLTRADDLDLGARTLVAAGMVLSAAELGILAFSESRSKKVVGALAPVIAFAAAAQVDQAYLNVRQSAQNIVDIANHATDILGQPAPEWAQYDNLTSG